MHRTCRTARTRSRPSVSVNQFSACPWLVDGFLLVAREHCSVRLPIRARSNATGDLRRGLSNILAETGNMVGRIPFMQVRVFVAYDARGKMVFELALEGTTGLCYFNWLMRHVRYTYCIVLNIFGSRQYCNNIMESDVLKQTFLQWTLGAGECEGIKKVVVRLSDLFIERITFLSTSCPK